MTVLDISYDCMQALGFEEFCMVTGGPHADQVRMYFGDRADYADQGPPRGIADAVYAAKSWVGEDPFAVVLGDQFWTADIGPHIQEYQKGGYDAAIWVKKLPEPWKHNVVYTNQDGTLREIIEKPHEIVDSGYAKEPGLTMLGIHLFQQSIFGVIEHQQIGHHKQEKNLAQTFTDLLGKNGRIKVFSLEREWVDCGTFANLDMASEIYRNVGRI